MAKKYCDVCFEDLHALMQFEVFEERLLVLYVLLLKFKEQTKEVFEFYVNHIEYLNCWALIDIYAHLIVGRYLTDRDRSFLFELASSKLWSTMRVAILATYDWIRKGDYTYTLKLAKLRWNDSHYLVEMAVGWMLREVGKKGFSVLEAFCRENSRLPKFVRLRLWPEFPALKEYTHPK